MPRHTRHDPDDDEDDDDYGDAGYGDDDDDAETVPCPHCGAEVYEGAEQCPRCGKYLSAEDRPSARPSGFVIVMMVLALLAALMWVLG
ncbi:zinc-ribbon domain-containing protein [bacterium]|nr:zinc-ribbon domain-containing protein [bacterium]